MCLGLSSENTVLISFCASFRTPRAPTVLPEFPPCEESTDSGFDRSGVTLSLSLTLLWPWGSTYALDTPGCAS